MLCPPPPIQSNSVSSIKLLLESKLLPTAAPWPTSPQPPPPVAALSTIAEIETQAATAAVAAIPTAERLFNVVV